MPDYDRAHGPDQTAVQMFVDGAHAGSLTVPAGMFVTTGSRIGRLAKAVTLGPGNRVTIHFAVPQSRYALLMSDEDWWH